LRDWLDSHLASSGLGVNPLELQRDLNIELRNAGLSCGDDGPHQTQCPDWTFLGFVGPIRVQWRAQFLVIRSGLGIECGFDESAYVYSWNGTKWVRTWENEQDSYTKDDYRPQTLDDVLISPYNRANDYLILTLGSESWCSSNWHDVYYRVFRMGPDPQAPPLVNGSEWTAVGFRNPPILGSISSDDVLIEYLRPSVDGGILAREGIFHYEIEHGAVKRTDPFALGPRDFVDEWLKTDWLESSHWSEGPNRRAMLEWRRKYVDKKAPNGEFLYPTMHCPTTPDLWQVGLNLTPELDSENDRAQKTYFLVRWHPPYQFRMVDVRDSAWPSCTSKDPAADDAKRRMFPVQDWR
jgi:hypothetical protein